MSVERFRAAQAARAAEREDARQERATRRGHVRGLRRGDRRTREYRYRNAERMRAHWQRRAVELGVGQ